LELVDPHDENAPRPSTSGGGCFATNGRESLDDESDCPKPKAQAPTHRTLRGWGDRVGVVTTEIHALALVVIRKDKSLLAETIASELPRPQPFTAFNRRKHDNALLQASAKKEDSGGTSYRR
jgi:hypothetical protein